MHILLTSGYYSDIIRLNLNKVACREEKDMENIIEKEAMFKISYLGCLC